MCYDRYDGSQRWLFVAEYKAHNRDHDQVHSGCWAIVNPSRDQVHLAVIRFSDFPHSLAKQKKLLYNETLIQNKLEKGHRLILFRFIRHNK